MTRALVEPKALPVKIRQMLRLQCDGEWDRVTVDDDGSYLVHNNATQAAKFVGRTGQPVRGQAAPTEAAPRKKWQPPPEKPLIVLPDAVTPPKKKAKKKQPAPPRKPADPEVVALASLIGSKAPAPRGGVTIVAAPKLEVVHDDEVKVSPIVGEPDWSQLDVDATAYGLLEKCRDGLPLSIPFTYKADVLALYGMDFDLLDSAIRHPERVEVRPETRQKKYPILGFYRGDILAILGMRMPQSPAVIAAYASSKLEPDTTHRPSGSTGGGGARKAAGLPTSVRASLRQLRAMGAEVDTEGLLNDAKATPVKYDGKVLGQVSIGEHVDRNTVQSDYQRMLRKINAIKDRQGVPA